MVCARIMKSDFLEFDVFRQMPIGRNLVEGVLYRQVFDIWKGVLFDYFHACRKKDFSQHIAILERTVADEFDAVVQSYGGEDFVSSERKSLDFSQRGGKANGFECDVVRKRTVADRLQSLSEDDFGEFFARCECGGLNRFYARRHCQFAEIRRAEESTGTYLFQALVELERLERVVRKGIVGKDFDFCGEFERTEVASAECEFADILEVFREN